MSPASKRRFALANPTAPTAEPGGAAAPQAVPAAAAPAEPPKARPEKEPAAKPAWDARMSLDRKSVV